MTDSPAAALGGRLDARALVTGLGGAHLRAGLIGLIEQGTLAPGAPLPTVREVAAELGVGVGTVAAVWAELRRDGYLITRRRGGTVTGRPGAQGIRQLRLGSAPADPALLPDLGAALAAVLAATPRPPSVAAGEILPELRRAAERRWKYPPEALSVVPSVRAALHLIVTTLLPARPVIASVDPLCARTAAALRAVPAQLIPVAVDEQGPVPASLAAALAAGAELFAYQPVASVPTGTSLSAERAAALAEVLALHPTVRVFEEDPAGPLRREGLSLGGLLPGQVLHAVNYRRAFGPEPAASVLSLPASDLAAIVLTQQREGAVVGALTQLLLAQLLTARDVNAVVSRAAGVYAARNAGLRAALRDEAVDAVGDGYFLWVPVADARRTARRLAAEGIQVAAGTHSSLTSRGRGRVRVGTTLVPDPAGDVLALAGAIAGAGRAS